MKKLFLIVIVILVIALGWFLLRGGEPAPSLEPNINGLPFGTGEDINIPGQTNQEILPDTSNFNESAAGAKLLRLSSTPVAGVATFNQSTTTTVVRYAERATGHIFDAVIRNGRVDKRRVTNNTLPKIYEAYFRSDGNAVLFRSLNTESEEIQNLSLALTPPRSTSTSTDSLYSISATSLRGEMDSILPGTGDILFYSLRDSNAIVSSTFSGANLRTILNSAFNNWRLSRAGNNLLVYTKASAEAPGYAYILNTSNGALNKILGPLNGLTAVASANGTRVLYSYSSGSDTKLSVKNLQDNSSFEVLPATLAEKCVWSAREQGTFYCGTPLNGLKGKEPDNWYLGRSHFSDYLWRFDSNNDVAKLIAEPKTDFGVDLDVYEPKLTPNEDYLVFINKSDLTLWALRLE